MRSVYTYLNYRDYLHDFYEERKKENPSFSYRLFSDKAGFKSKSFLIHVIDGKKNLSLSSIDKLNNILKLPIKQFSYFKDLVAFNQAKKIDEKNMHFEKLCTYNRTNSARYLLQQQYELCSKWYNWTLRELVEQVDFKDDFALLGSLCHPPIPARDTQKAIQQLLDLNIIKKEDGRYKQTDAIITTGNEVRSLAVSNFHLQNLNLAGESIDTTPSPERDISALVLGLSNKGFEKVKSEITKFRKKLLAIAEQEKEINRVYHVNFQLYPTTKDLNKDVTI